MAGDDLTDRTAKASLQGPESRQGGFFGYDRYRVTLNDTTTTRDVVRIGRVAVILAIDMARDEVVLIRQFRLGAHLALGTGDLVEVPAGRVNKNESPRDGARRELREETGLEAEALVPLFDMMPSPGSSDEHMFFFLATVDATNLPKRAGAADEHEDTQPLRVSTDRVLDALKTGQLHYGAGVVALQWLALNRDRLPEVIRSGHPVP